MQFSHVGRSEYENVAPQPAYENVSNREKEKPSTNGAYMLMWRATLLNQKSMEVNYSKWYDLHDIHNLCPSHSNSLQTLINKSN